MAALRVRKNKTHSVQAPTPQPMTAAPVPVEQTRGELRQTAPVYRADVVLFLFWTMCMIVMATLLTYESIAGLLGRR
jgi:hypothetical protein